MKTKITVLIFAISFSFFFISCKKENAIAETNPPKSFMLRTSLPSKTDGIITVQTAILPPVTQKTFISNGNISTTEFDIVSTKRILLDELYFSAPAALVQSINIEELGPAPNMAGTVRYDAAGMISAGSGIALHTHVYYKTVDSTTSGRLADLKLTHIIYRTDDNVYHDFYPENSGAAQTMCLVCSLPHLALADPKSDTFANGLKEIVMVQLSGDSDWTLNALPLAISSPFEGTISKCKLIVKNESVRLRTESDSMELHGGETAQVVIHFAGGFHHTAGKKERLKIFAPVSQDGLITTVMSPAGAFAWTDNSGIRITGIKNEKFFKDQTGQSNFP